jgi:L-threonylcarbamoyladenylate synthase
MAIRHGAPMRRWRHRVVTLVVAVSELAARLGMGEAGLFPTDTLPALASQPGSAEQLWTLKRRPVQKPVILMAARAGELWEWLGVQPRQEWLELTARHWPGALTLVLPASTPQLQCLNPGGDSLGLRVPDCPAALGLLARSGPLATTSANRSGEAPCLTADQAAQQFPTVALLGPVPWPAPSGLASTVVRWHEADAGWEVLRQGAVQV